MHGKKININHAMTKIFIIHIYLNLQIMSNIIEKQQKKLLIYKIKRNGSEIVDKVTGKV